MTWVETGSGGQPHGLAQTCSSTARVDVGEGADSAGYGAGGDFLACVDKAGTAAVELGIGLGHLQPEGHGFGVDAVRSTDADGVLVLDGATLDGGEERIHVGEQKVGGLDQLDVEAGVEDIGGSHALMDEAGIGADNLSQVGKEGDDVVLGFALDFIDAVDVEGGVAALFPDGLRGLFRNDSEFGQCIAGMGLDLEPDPELRFRRPDCDHFRAGVTRYHGKFRKGWRCGGSRPFSGEIKRGISSG